MARLDENSLRNFLDSEFANPAQEIVLKWYHKRRDGAEIVDNNNNADIYKNNEQLGYKNPTQVTLIHQRPH